MSDNHTHNYPHDYIDIYCERLGPGFWAEPVNFLTNGCFLIAAGLAMYHARKSNALTFETVILSAILACIGIGSGLFHSFATGWAMAADVIPILLFQLVFIGIYSRKVIGMDFLKLCTAYAGFFTLIAIFEQVPREIMNDSLSYAPAAIYLGGFAIFHYVREKQQRLALVIAFGTFILSLTFRSIDMVLCSYIPLGTHFLWHVLNSVVLYFTIRSLFGNLK